MAQFGQLDIPFLVLRKPERRGWERLWGPDTKQSKCIKTNQLVTDSCFTDNNTSSMQRYGIGHLSVPSSEAYPNHCSRVAAVTACSQTARMRNRAFTLREEHAIEECGSARNPEAEILFKTCHAWSGRTCPGFRAVLLFRTLVPVLARYEQWEQLHEAAETYKLAVSFRLSFGSILIPSRLLHSSLLGTLHQITKMLSRFLQHTF